MKITNSDAKHRTRYFYEKTELEDPIEKAITSCEDNLQQYLGALNTRIEMGQAGIGEMLQFADPIVNNLLSSLQGEISQEVADNVLRIIGMLVSSIERHLRFNGEAPGAALRLMPNEVEKTLIKCSQRNGRGVPRDDHETYWGLPKIITFTGSQAEISFSKTVKITNQILDQAILQLESLKLADFAAEQTQAELQKTLTLLEALLDQFRKLDKDLQLKPGGFEQFRQYLGRYPVAGNLYTGPNAKFFHHFGCMDLLLGVPDACYKNQLANRGIFMDPQKYSMLVCRMSAPSIADLLQEHLGLNLYTASDVISIALALSERTLAYQKSFAFLVKITRAWIQISGNHLAQIRRNLPNNAQNALIVDSNKGVSGAPLEDTFNIHRLRQACWLNTKSLKALKMLEDAR